jgi:hypothetical protein
MCTLRWFLRLREGRLMMGRIFMSLELSFKSYRSFDMLWFCTS